MSICCQFCLTIIVVENCICVARLARIVYIVFKSTYKFERPNFRTGRWIAPKFGTHVPIDTLTLIG